MSKNQQDLHNLDNKTTLYFKCLGDKEPIAIEPQDWWRVYDAKKALIQELRAIQHYSVSTSDISNRFKSGDPNIIDELVEKCIFIYIDGVINNDDPFPPKSKGNNDVNSFFGEISDEQPIIFYIMPSSDPVDQPRCFLYDIPDFKESDFDRLSSMEGEEIGEIDEPKYTNQVEIEEPPNMSYLVQSVLQLLSGQGDEKLVRECLKNNS